MKLETERSPLCSLLYNAKKGMAGNFNSCLGHKSSQRHPKRGRSRSKRGRLGSRSNESLRVDPDE